MQQDRLDQITNTHLYFTEIFEKYKQGLVEQEQFNRLVQEQFHNVVELVDAINSDQIEKHQVRQVMTIVIQNEMIEKIKPFDLAAHKTAKPKSKRDLKIAITRINSNINATKLFENDQINIKQFKRILNTSSKVMLHIAKKYDLELMYKLCRVTDDELVNYLAS